MPKQSVYASEAFKKLKAGVDKLNAAVSGTLGPKGHNVIIDTPETIVTKDGVTVAKYFDLEDPVERVGVRIVQQASEKMNKVGDGTTTTTLLAKEIIGLCLEKAEKEPDLDVHSLRKEMNEDVESICRNLDGISLKVEDEETLKKIATISANNDPDLGNLVGSTVWKTSKDGVVTVEEWSGTNIVTEYEEGFQIPSGPLSTYMFTNPQKGECVLNDCLVLVTDRKITSATEMIGILEKTATGFGEKEKAQRQLVIICDDVEGDALITAVSNKLQGKFTTLCLKAPGHGDHRKGGLEDLALMLGATFVSDETGTKLDGLKYSHLGKARKILSTKERTIFIGGNGDKEAIEGRVKELDERREKALGAFDKQKYSERKAHLLGGVAIIKVGAYSEAEMSEKKYLIEDAVCASKAALEEGYVPGGGMALWNAAHGEGIITQACRAPFRQICLNAGRKGEIHPPAVGGYDAKKGHEVPDMIAEGIIDPTKVVKEALRNACSVASLFLTTEAVLYDNPKKE